ncbi:MAG TPA: sulfatase-like hydrolase/transferase [Phnomibacter sp.]|nr:sulfatase-like hydrolase/transferase [Phnomibacter sp.]
MGGTRLMRSIVILGAVCIGSSCSGIKNEKEKTKPNIIIILADDAGYADFGFMGSEDIQTPHLDALRGDGALFTQHYVSSSVCSPSRAGLLTGKYQQRFGHECNLEPEQPLAFDTAQITIAEALKQQGYRTAIFGKWHLGDHPHHHPLNNGFDTFWGFIAGGRRYFTNEKDDRPGSLNGILNDREPDVFEGYLTDVLGHKAVNYIEGSKDDPFFIYLAFNAPHTPMDAKEDIVSKFKEKTNRPVYAAMMWSMDEAIGKVIQKLKETGKYDNTLIFFLSDNGGAHNNNSSVAPLKGWKGNEFEGGIRTPLIVSWPSKLKGERTYSGVASSLDIFMTALRASGAKEQGLQVDGKDLIPYLRSGDLTVHVHDELYWRKDKMAAARIGDHKLIRLLGEQTVLYDIKNDLREQHDVSSRDTFHLKQLNHKLEQWESTIMKPIWTEPEAWNTVTRMIFQDLMNGRSIRARAPEDLKKK